MDRKISVISPDRHAHGKRRRPSDRPVFARASGITLLVFLALLVAGCGAKEPPPPGLEGVRFTETGLTLQLSAPQPGATLEVETSQGLPVQTLRIGCRDIAPRLLFYWDPGVSYRFILKDARGRPGTPFTLQSPERQALTGILRLPYGQAEARFSSGGDTETALITGGGPLQMGIELGVRQEAPLAFSLAITVPDGLTLEGSGQYDGRLSAIDPSFLMLRTIRVPPGEGAYPVTLTLHFRQAPDTSLEDVAGPDGVTLRACIVLLARPAEEVAEDIEVVSQPFPTDPRGRPQSQRMPDTVALPNPLWQALGALFGARALKFDPYAPYAYQAIRFRNHTSYPVTLLLTARVRSPHTDLDDPAFVPQAFEVTGGLGRITTLARIPAGATGSAQVPFYVRKEVREGRYPYDLEVRLLGSDVVLHRLERTITVVRSDLRVNLTLLVVVPLCFGSLIFLILRYRRIISALDARALTTIALFGALMFSAGFLVELLSTGLNAILGPFNILVGGVLYEILHHLILTTLLVLQPRAGTAMLVGLTHYLLRGITTGQMSPLDLLFVGSSLTYKEAALYALGITRKPLLLEQLRRSPRQTQFRMVLALGLAAGATAFTSLALHTAFYRLFFASWYVWLTVLVGLLGPCPGVLSGVRFGRMLDRTRL